MRKIPFGTIWYGTIPNARLWYLIVPFGTFVKDKKIKEQLTTYRTSICQ